MYIKRIIENIHNIQGQLREESLKEGANEKEIIIAPEKKGVIIDSNTTLVLWKRKIPGGLSISSLPLLESLIMVHYFYSFHNVPGHFLYL